jgi:hypothetical protein
MSRMIFRFAPLAAALALGACAGDSMPNLFQTASVAPTAEQTAAATPQRTSRIDPACVTLAGQIDTLRKEGTIERLEKVATGKGDNVQVKRTALAKQTELNKANAEFQTKCGPRIPQQAAAPASPTLPSAAVAAAPMVKAAAAKVAPAVSSGVTAVPSALPTVPSVPKAP